jgi:hypothetical protein
MLAGAETVDELRSTFPLITAVPSFLTYYEHVCERHQYETSLVPQRRALAVSFSNRYWRSVTAFPYPASQVSLAPRSQHIED